MEVDKPKQKRTYTKRKQVKQEPEKQEPEKQEPDKLDSETLKNYPDINNIEHPDVKNKVLNVLKGIF